MIFMCVLRFDIQEEQRLLLNKYLLYQEIQTVKEENETQVNTFEPISDTEEDIVLSDQIQLTEHSLSETVRGKRGKSIVSEPEDE